MAVVYVATHKRLFNTDMWCLWGHNLFLSVCFLYSFVIPETLLKNLNHLLV